MTRKITVDDINFTKKFYNNIKAKDIAKELGLTTYQVYEIAKRNGLSRKQNKKVKMNNIMHQIIISGVIGDGRLKKNGRYNYYYSECHALDETEYLLWKHSNLGELTTNSSIYKKNSMNEHTDALEFTTLTTPTLIEYAQMSIRKIIGQLNDLGILLFMLDDGWTIKYKSGFSVRISGGELTSDEMSLFATRCDDVLGVKPAIIGNKRKDFSFKAAEDKTFLNIIKKYNMKDLDVVVKKFGKI